MNAINIKIGELIKISRYATTHLHQTFVTNYGHKTENTTSTEHSTMYQIVWSNFKRKIFSPTILPSWLTYDLAEHCFSIFFWKHPGEKDKNTFLMKMFLN